MKRILIGITILAVGGTLAYFAIQERGTVDYVAPEIITNTVTQEVDALNAEIEKAITASSTSIQEEAQGAYDATVERLEKEIELRVRRGQKEKLDTKIEELEKQIGVY